jgi:hypothetical protein
VAFDVILVHPSFPGVMNFHPARYYTVTLHAATSKTVLRNEWLAFKHKAKTSS